jgi:adenosylmethionine-8-amino-7-oxononanoate aminotransferase
MTGWGRTGTLFACEQAGIAPDIMCLAKGLTGGVVPLAVTLCREEIFAAHYAQDRTRTFFHSSSYTANPIACAAAVANVEIWRSEPVLERIAQLSGRQATHLAALGRDARVQNIRQIGTIAALDFNASDAGYLAGIGLRLYDFFLERGVLLRPLGNTVYVMPPYCTEEEGLRLAYDAIGEAADAFLR